MGETIQLKDKGLKDLIRAFKGKTIPVARVGILGDKNSRSSTKNGVTNAQVGAAHEFGTEKLPIRSFLRMPLSTELSKALEKSGAFTREALAKVVEEKSLTPYVEKIAVVAVGVVLEAFDSGGYGKWTPSDMTHKKVHQTLVESQQLRNSITSGVVNE